MNEGCEVRVSVKPVMGMVNEVDVDDCSFYVHPHSDTHLPTLTTKNEWYTEKQKVSYET